MRQCRLARGHGVRARTLESAVADLSIQHTISGTPEIGGPPRNNEAVECRKWPFHRRSGCDGSVKRRGKTSAGRLPPLPKALRRATFATPKRVIPKGFKPFRKRSRPTA